MNNYSFCNGFYSWEKISNKELNYIAFRKAITSEIQKVEDSISKNQNQLVTQTKYLIDNIDKLTYTEFKDGIRKILAELAYQSSYYKTVVNQVSKNKQDYVIQLYKDFPENSTLIKFSIEKNKTLIQKLTTIQNTENN